MGYGGGGGGGGGGGTGGGSGGSGGSGIRRRIYYTVGGWRCNQVLVASDSDRPENAPLNITPGAIRFNTDSMKLEYFRIRTEGGDTTIANLGNSIEW